MSIERGLPTLDLMRSLRWVKNGILSQSTLGQIWRSYPKEIHSTLLHLLSKFEIAQEFYTAEYFELLSLFCLSYSLMFP